MIASIKSFSADVVKEMKKVAWPTWPQLKESTTVVVVTCLVLTVFVWIVDLAMTLINQALF